MTDDQYNEAKKLVAELGSMLPASKAMGIPYPTFRRQFLKRQQSESTPQSQSDSEPESENLTPGINWDEVLAPAREHERRRWDEQERQSPYRFRFPK